MIKIYTSQFFSGWSNLLSSNFFKATKISFLCRYFSWQPCISPLSRNFKIPKCDTRYRPTKPYNCKSNRYLNGFMVDILKQKGQVFSRLDYIKKENLNFYNTHVLVLVSKKKKEKKKLKKDGDHLTPCDCMNCINIVSCQSLKPSRYGPKQLNIHEMMT